MCVEDNNIAWHAGTSTATGRSAFWKTNNVNPRSIGIELEGYAATGFTQTQLDSAVKLGRYLKTKYHISSRRAGDHFGGHHLHSEISNQRSDPGVHFPFDDILSKIG